MVVYTTAAFEVSGSITGLYDLMNLPMRIEFKNRKKEQGLPRLELDGVLCYMS